MCWDAGPGASGGKGAGNTGCDRVLGALQTSLRSILIRTLSHNQVLSVHRNGRPEVGPTCGKPASTPLPRRIPGGLVLLQTQGQARRWACGPSPRATLARARLPSRRRTSPRCQLAWVAGPSPSCARLCWARIGHWGPQTYCDRLSLTRGMFSLAMLTLQVLPCPLPC